MISPVQRKKNKLLKQITDYEVPSLRSRIEELESENVAQRERVSGLERNVEAKSETVKYLNTDIKDLKRIISRLELENAKVTGYLECVTQERNSDLFTERMKIDPARETVTTTSMATGSLEETQQMIPAPNFFKPYTPGAARTEGTPGKQGKGYRHFEYDEGEPSVIWFEV